MTINNIKAEIFSTGDEVLWGDIDDTNASWLARKLRESGIDVMRTSCAGDRLEDLVAIIHEISVRADVVLVTGGLGPTSDDLSAEAAAIASDDSIALNPVALSYMESYFARKGWELSDANKKQAMLPSKAGVMENTCGTAPGFHIDCGKAIFFFMPGVPKEMKKMYELSVLPCIKERFAANPAINSSCLISRFKLFGLPESQVGNRLRNFNDIFPQFKLGFRASFPLIEVKFSTTHQNSSGYPDICSGERLKKGEIPDPAGEKNQNIADRIQEANSSVLCIEQQMADAAKWITDRLDGYIFSSRGLNMEQELGTLLASRKKTVAVAESCTGGLIGSMLTDVAGSSDYFLLSAVTYSNAAKINILGVNPDTIMTYGAVHEETAKEMAQGVRKVAGADYGVATSGIAGPDGGSEDKPVGTVCIGIAGDGFTKAFRYKFSFGDRSMNKKIFAVKAMDMLRREILL